MDEKMVIGFTGKVVPEKPVNDQMTLCKCYVMALGKNQNKTNISKEASDNALPSLFNIPVVGHMYVDKDNTCRMGGHDMALEKDEDGNYRFKVLTVPYGVVPQQDNVHYEEVEENDGTKKTYLVADVILWTGRYPDLLSAKYSEDIYFAQSMEINPSKTSKEDGFLNVEEYQYSALCLLGKSDDASKNIEPCFEQARVEPYDYSATEEWTKLFGEFKEELAKCYEKQGIEKGGEKALNTEMIANILAEFELSEITQLSFEITEDMTEEMLRNKLQEYVAVASDETNVDTAIENAESKEQVEFVAEDATATNENESNVEPLKFSIELTCEEKRKILCGLLNKACIWNETEYISYYLIDFDSEFVYCEYRHCGNDIAEVKCMLRIPYAESGEALALNLTESERVRLVWLTKADEDKLANDKQQLAELTEYKKTRVEEDRRKEFALVIDEFKDLGDIEDYKEVVKNAMCFESSDALREKLYALRGKYLKPAGKKPITQIRIPVGFAANKTNSELDEFMSKYLPSKK